MDSSLGRPLPAKDLALTSPRASEAFKHKIPDAEEVAKEDRMLERMEKKKIEKKQGNRGGEVAASQVKPLTIAEQLKMAREKMVDVKQELADEGEVFENRGRL